MLNLLALFNFFVGIATVAVYFKFGEPQYILWLCNHQSFVYALAIWKRNPRWITAELTLGIIPQLLWGIDYLWRLLTGNFIWGITQYMFIENYATSTYYISLQHLILAPVALYALHRIGKPSMRDWKLAVVHVVLMITLTFALTGASYNINCAYRNACIPFLPETIPLWPVIWAAITLFLVVLPTNYLLYELYKLF